MIPFRLTFIPGIPVHEQVAFAAKKAMISGQLRPRDAFPSVRVLSQAMKIHANTAQKVVAQLTAEGLLEVRPGIGTVVVRPPPSTRVERSRLLGRELEQLTVEAKRLHLTLADLHAAIDEHWRRLEITEEKR
ncbi:MAG TPA: GntR family transcriptional regulator [Bryobacteraceae bacterium]|nr:GntR family transcriptional regulator [Bryobacteraceae bacterium]